MFRDFYSYYCDNVFYIDEEIELKGGGNNLLKRKK